MRAALISLAGQPRVAADGAAVSVAGRSLALRQLDFAKAAGAEGIIALGDGASAEAIAMRHAAERAGARFQVIRDGHGLLGLVRANDELLVLAPGLLPQAPEALTLLSGGSGLLVLPAGAGVAAGFERIDIERAWSGALLASGGLLERLAELPPESDPAPALLRIALQMRVPERRLSAGVLADGTWTMVPADGSSDLLGRSWLQRNLPPVSRYAATKVLSRAALAASGAWVLERGRSAALLVASSLLLLAGAAVLSGFGFAAAGFAVLALGHLVGESGSGVLRLRSAPFARPEGRWGWRRWQGWLADAALLVCAALALDGAWLHRLFPPLVLIGALKASRVEGATGVAALLGDRSVIAVVLAIAAAIGVTEPALMVLALAVIALDAASKAGRRG